MQNKIAFGIIISVLFIMLVVLFCAILIKLYIQKIKKYNQIIYQKEIDHQAKLNQSILETQEQTFNEISKELHDDAGQQLTYINFQLENLKLDNQNIENQINSVSQSLAQLSKTIRSLSHSLNNQILSQQNLIKAIEIETERLNKNKNVAINLKNTIQENIAFSTHEKIVIYRIFQESINNILKHAHSKTIDVALENTIGFKMTIQDYGKGFNVEKEINQSKSNGLRNMISRAEIINFQVSIYSEINNGTTVVLENKRQDLTQPK